MPRLRHDINERVTPSPAYLPGDAPVMQHGAMDATRISGLVLFPGAAGRRTAPGLVAIDERVSAVGVAVERAEFPGQAAGKRRPDPPEVCIETVRAATLALADRIGATAEAIAIGGRSFGGRMCSLAVAQGLDVAALVLVSYPLHPPGRPDQLRTAHFQDLRVPCLFVSGRRDPFATPEELERETARIPGDVTITLVDGDHGLRRAEGAVGDEVVRWMNEPADRL